MLPIPSGPARAAAQHLLKVGVVVDDWSIAAWAYRALEQTQHTGLVEFALVLMSGRTPGYSDAPGPEGPKRNPVYRFYHAVDRKLFCRTPGALQPKDVRTLLYDIPVLSIGSARDCCRASRLPEVVERIRQSELDLLVHFGSTDLPEPILSFPKLGVWTYHHAEPGERAGNPPGFWETAEGRRETGATLIRLADGQAGGQVLQQLRFPTYPLSPARNQEYCLWASSSLVSRQVRQLSRTQDASPARATFNPPACPEPSAIRTLQAASRVFIRHFSRIPKKLFCPDQWSLLFDLDGNPPGFLQKYRRIVPPADRFWADPHVVREGAHYFVFFEDYSYRMRKGRISVAKIDADGRTGQAIVALEEPYHLSYPCVFPWSGKYYMVPESSENRTIDLYECISFPNRWQKKLTLMDQVSAVDTTLFHHNGKWWMFTAMAENEEAFPNVELFIFCSDELLSSNWRPHTLNPVITDGTRARPAGAIFREDGRIYRPSQDCSRSYGYGFDLNEILVLSETEYSERTVTSVRPSPEGRAKATHTFARAGRLTVVDALFSRPRWSRKLV